MSDVDERCAVCTEPFAAPHDLPCGHAFCQQCIDTLGKGRAACPVCRAPFVLPPGGAGALPLSSALAAMATAARARASEESSKRDLILCGLCEEIDISTLAAALCPTCNEHLCAKHAEHHRRKRSAHDMVELDSSPVLFPSADVAPTPPMPKAPCCLTHPAHVLRAVCSCDELLCQECVFGEHSEHSFTVIEKFAADSGRKLPSTIAALDRHNAALQGALGAVADTEETLRAMTAAAEHAIDNMRGRVVARVTTRAEALRAGLREVADRKGRQLDARREALELVLVRVQGLWELGTQALDGEDTCGIVRASWAAERQAQALRAPRNLEPVTSGAVEVLEDGAGAVEAAVGTMGAVRDNFAAAMRELTDERITNRRVWGNHGTGEGEFSGLCMVALGRNGCVYVADLGNRRVQMFGKNGMVKASKWHDWGSQGHGDGQSFCPRGIACGPDGSVYVTDQTRNQVLKFESDGSIRFAWGSQGNSSGQFQGPLGIAYGPDGCVYVADEGNHRVQVFRSDGTFVRVFGCQGKGNGQLQNPAGIACGPDGSVYVADWNNHRVQVFRSDGTFVRAWGSKGKIGDGQFNYPIGVACGVDGSVYVTDFGNHRAQVFRSDGTFVRAFGTGTFRNPAGIACGPDGSVYVCNSGVHWVHVF
jgi:DNA-binding beta-propeller fold protein YncE